MRIRLTVAALVGASGLASVAVAPASTAGPTSHVIAGPIALAAAGPTARAAAGPIARAAAGPIAFEPYASKLAAYGGVLAWSHWDPVAQVFRLTARIHGRTDLLPVRARAVPFDVDLGPDGRGRTVAVYSRCSRADEAVWEQGVTATRAPLPRGCSLYQYAFATGRERRLGTAAGSGSFYLPSIWRDELAYVRVRGSGPPALYEQPLTQPTEVVRRGATVIRRRLRIVARALPGGDPSRTGPGPVSLSLRAGRLAVAWDGGDGSGGWSSAILLDTVPAARGGRPAGVTLDAETADSRSPGFFASTALSAAGVFYAGFDGSQVAAPGDEFARIGFDGGGSASAAAPHALRGLALDGSVTYAMYGPYTGQFGTCGGQECAIVALRGVHYG
jgi:hypothetical protein